ncbi:MAG: hypothetical protein Q6370_025415 [Candidatus Sigynarchaeota archaeon]
MIGTKLEQPVDPEDPGNHGDPTIVPLSLFARVNEYVIDAENKGKIYFSLRNITGQLLGNTKSTWQIQCIGRALHAMERAGRLGRFGNRTWFIVKNKWNRLHSQP